MKKPVSYCLASSFTSCSGRQESRDYCSKHYQQVQMHGRPVVTRFDKRPAIVSGGVAKISLGIGAKDGFAIVDASDTWVDKFNWSRSSAGYAQTRIGSRPVLMHVLLMGKTENKEIDHINIDRLDNRRSNLRSVTHGENMYNLPLAKNNTSGARGVYFDKRKNRWCAQIQKGRKNQFVGYFKTIEEARAARINVEKRLFNFTNGQAMPGWKV